MRELPKIIFITDTSRVDVIASAKKLQKKSAIILRDYDLSFSERYSLGLQLKKICAQKHIPLLVAGDAKLALKLNADGMHFPEYAHVYIRKWRKIRPDWIITAAAHSRRAVFSAMEAGANACLVSPVYATASHPEAKPLGHLRIKNLCGKHAKNIYGLGGISAKRAKTLESLGFRGFAGVSGV